MIKPLFELFTEAVKKSPIGEKASNTEVNVAIGYNLTYAKDRLAKRKRSTQRQEETMDETS